MKVVYSRYSKSSIYQDYRCLDVCLWKLSFYDSYWIHHGSGMLLTVVFTEKTVTIKIKSNSFQYLMRRKLPEKGIFKTQIFKSKYKIGPEEESKSENVHVQRLSDECSWAPSLVKICPGVLFLWFIHVYYVYYFII